MTSINFHVLDTYVKAKDWHTIHFDVITNNNIEKVISFVKEWLKSIKEESVKITTEKCRFYHTQSIPKDVEIEIMTMVISFQKWMDVLNN